MGVNPLYLKAREPKRQVIYTYTLDIQCWTGIEKPQMTFPFKSEENGEHLAVIGPQQL